MNANQAKICVVIGTRAQLIKTAPVMQEMQKRGIAYYFLHTGQHNDTFKETLDDFGLPEPDAVVVDWGQEAKTVASLARWSTRAFLALRHGSSYLPFSDGIVLVHGDTPSAVWGTFLGKLTRNRVFHLESGLRSFNIFQPFPEELIRVFLPYIVDIYACPGEWALANINKQKGEKINTIQNTAVDGLRYILETFPDSGDRKKPFVLASFHRVENMYNDERLRQIVDTIEQTANNYHIIFPMHPLTKSRLIKNGYMDRLISNANVELCDRLPYAQFIPLLDQAEFLLTDSGSMQEEIVWLGLPMLVFRDATERKEGIGENVILSHYDPQIIDSFLDNPQTYRRDRHFPNISPSSIVVDWLEDTLGL
ncbi:MAG: UDP-N-acetylglucosamine 2-epimerase [Anaerolineae bacterium]